MNINARLQKLVSAWYFYKFWAWGPLKFVHGREAIPILSQSFLERLRQNFFVHGVFGLKNIFETIFSRLNNTDNMVTLPNRFRWSQILSKINMSDDTFWFEINRLTFTAHKAYSVLQITHFSWMDWWKHNSETLCSCRSRSPPWGMDKWIEHACHRYSGTRRAKAYSSSGSVI